MSTYPKRLIEVDLPIKRISAHARREKSIRHGHISTLHIWWARRPLAACRAVICAALWPDPADPNCPLTFREQAAQLLCDFAEQVRSDATLAGLCKDSWSRWSRTKATTLRPDHAGALLDMRYALLDFIADFANWDASTMSAFLRTARGLTQAAHEALGGAPGTNPMVVDPFAGGGAIPLEALRVGAAAYASDLNPVAVLLNKVVLEYIPRYGRRLADEVRQWGEWIKQECEKELAQFYPNDPDGATPIAYLWARTITCEGPACGAEVPLVRSLWLAKEGERSAALRIIPNGRDRRVDFEIIETAKLPDVGEGTVRQGSATCPVCGYTTSNVGIRAQLANHRGGASNSRLIAVVCTHPRRVGRSYRLPTQRDLDAAEKAVNELEKQRLAAYTPFPLIPDEQIPTARPSPNARGLSGITRIGMRTFGDIFTPRQALALATLSRLVRDVGQRIATNGEPGLVTAVQSILACAVDREAEHWSSLCRWNPIGQKMQHAFSRQALSVVWDFCEANPFGGSVGSWDSIMECVLIPFETSVVLQREGHAEHASATTNPLPDDTANVFFTDPPYYDSVPYADISDFFYVWLRRSLLGSHPDLFDPPLTPKDEEAIWNPSRIYSRTGTPKDQTFYELQMFRSFAEAAPAATPSRPYSPRPPLVPPPGLPRRRASGHLPQVPQQLPHFPPAQPVAATQQRDHRRQARPERPPRHPGR
jgi:putative DNA methylase